MMIFVIFSIVASKSRRSKLAVVAVIAAALVNEIMDWAVGKAVNTGEPVSDIANTIFWPTMVYISSNIKRT